MSAPCVTSGTGIWLVGLAIVGAAILGARSPASGAPAGKGVIAYSFVEQAPGFCDGCDDAPAAGGRSWIELVDPDGTHRKRLACTTGSFDTCRDGSPVFSPDGTRLAVLNDREVVIARLDGSVLRRIAVPALAVAWSPDGRRLAFTQNYTDPPAPSRFAVYVTRLGGSPRRVTGARNVDPFGLSWSARGVMAWEKLGSRPGIYVSGPRGENRHRILRTQGAVPWFRPQYLPRWSPDGAGLPMPVIRRCVPCGRTAPASAC